jgi:cyclase
MNSKGEVMLRLKTLTLIIVVGFAFHQAALAQQGDVEINTIKITDNIYMLQGPGGNIGVMTGDDGVFMIDDQFATSNPAILSAISRITDKKVKFLINTHWHPDHTGGNELMGKAGSIIIAHDNVRRRLTEEQFMEYFNADVQPLSKDGLPVITFDDRVTLHYNGDEIDVFHVVPAHTDGDAVVYFKNANVLHAGDVVMTGRYPFIDYKRGGSAEGYIRAIDMLLDVIDDQTKIIPGHGAPCNKQELLDFQKMLSTVTGRIKSMKETEMSLEDIIAARPSSEFDDRYEGPVAPDDFVMLVYKSLN